MDNKKRISSLSATFLGTTAMVGSGWLFSAQLNAKLAGNYAFAAWIIAAGIAILVAICLAKVVAKYPVRGATSMCSSLSHNQIFGMPFAFANWFVVMVAIANEAQATTEYLSSAINNSGLMIDSMLTLKGKFCALLLLCLYLLINFYGIKLLARVNNVITAFKMFVPLFTIVIFLIAKFDTSNFSLASSHIYSPSSIVNAIIGAGLIYSYNGFQLPAAFASEIKNPDKSVLISMVGGILIILVFYLLLQLAFMAAVPHELLNHGGWTSLNFHSPLMNLALLLGLHFIVLLLVADSVVSPSGTGYSYLGASSRMFYAMALSGQMPKWCIGELHNKYNICRRSMLINFGLTVLALFNSDSWTSLMVILTGFTLVGYMAAPISMGAISPKMRFFGVIVFAIISLILFTITKNDFFKINITISILMFSYSITLLKDKSISIKDILIFIAPFIIYLWTLYVCNIVFLAAIIAIVFYVLITDKRYVKFCNKRNATDKLILFQGEVIFH